MISEVGLKCLLIWVDAHHFFLLEGPYFLRLCGRCDLLHLYTFITPSVGADNVDSRINADSIPSIGLADNAH